MGMTMQSDILSVSLCNDTSSRHIAEIALQSGLIQRPTWKGLYRYWQFARANKVEYSAVSFSGYFSVFCFTVASGQNGIIAVWNAFRRRWEQVSEADYVVCAMILEDISAVVSFHYVSYWGVPAHHRVYATPLERTLDVSAEISSQVQAVYTKGGIDPKRERIHKAAYGDYVSNKHGPLGIFLQKGKRNLLAHDSGNLYKFSVEEVERALDERS